MTAAIDRERLLQQLKAIYFRVKQHFHDTPDRGERWNMPSPDYDGGQVIRDDCDGFCLACRVLLRRAGLPSRLVYCEIDRRGHLVVEVEGWILDNRQQTVVANTLLTAQHYRWLMISGFNPGDPWREIIAWE